MVWQGTRWTSFSRKMELWVSRWYKGSMLPLLVFILPCFTWNAVYIFIVVSCCHYFVVLCLCFNMFRLSFFLYIFTCFSWCLKVSSRNFLGLVTFVLSFWFFLLHGVYYCFRYLFSLFALCPRIAVPLFALLVACYHGICMPQPERISRNLVVPGGHQSRRIG